jgi:outer membrane receptor protein involved in Fe transport
VIFPDDNQRVSEGTSASNAQRQFNLLDSVSLAAGRHRYKFGADYRRLKPTDFSGNALVFTRVQSAAFLRTGLVSFGAPSASEPVTVRTSNISVFAQDTFQVTSRLTLNYGLRWDINTAPTSADDQRPLYPIQGVFDSQPLRVGPAGAPIYGTDYTGFAPRIGVAYQLTPKTVLRGGFGVFYDMGYPALFGQMTAAFPYI